MFDDLIEMFDLKSEATKGLAPGVLGSHSTENTETIKYTLEVTVALPQNWQMYKFLSLPDKLDLYRNVWDEVCRERNMQKSAYVIEYHKNKEPHIHGHMEYHVPAPMCLYEDHMLRDIGKLFYKKVPKRYWNHYLKAEVNNRLGRFKSPLVTINIKTCLEMGWRDYINKDQSNKQ